METVRLEPDKLRILKKGGVWVPAPLALDQNLNVLEDWQRLLTLYYIRSGAGTVIPGAHTGEFALGDDALYEKWLTWNREVVDNFGEEMFLMSAVSNLRQAEISAEKGYDIVLVSPRAFADKSEEDAIAYCREIASIIPVYGFYLQTAVGGPALSQSFWEKFFEFAYGAKTAPFNREKTQDVLRAAANCDRLNELVFATGNDDHIVYDLFSKNRFQERGKVEVKFSAGLLGHFATDTHAAVELARSILRARENEDYEWGEAHSLEYLAALVTYRNYTLFDVANDFQNSVMGVKQRLVQLGLLLGAYVSNERGREGLDDEIRSAYKGNLLTDDKFVRENLDQWKKEIGMI